MGLEPATNAIGASPCFEKDDNAKSNFLLKIQQTSNDTYFRVHDINTSLVDAENTNLENEIKYSFSKPDMYFDINASIFEDLRVKNNSDRYEYILPNIIYGKTFFSEKFGALDLKSNAFYSNYDTNKHKTFLTNDVIWTPSNHWKTVETDDPIGDLGDRLEQRRPMTSYDLPKFWGGAVGYFGYDTVRLIEDLPNQPQDDLGLPDGLFAFMDVVLVVDNVTGSARAIASVEVDEDVDVKELKRRYVVAEEKIEDLN